MYNFKSYFDGIESHFINEMVINMYSRIFESHTNIVKYKKDFTEVYFIT